METVSDTTLVYNGISSRTAPRVWLFGDYNQAESRVVAWLTPIPKLKQWYEEGVDVHGKVCNLVAAVIQKQNVPMPTNPETGHQLFKGKVAGNFGKGDEEREISKRQVHGSNYEMGIDKLALTMGVSEEVAKILYAIYHTLFPEVKQGYHKLVRSWIDSSRTIWTPEPVRFRKIYYGKIDDALYRSAYSAYPQITVGAMLNRTLGICAKIFLHDEREALRDQWCAWYGSENWDTWRSLRDKKMRTPQAIRWSGMDIRLNVHDAGGLSIPNDPDLIRWAATEWRRVGQEPIIISPTNHLVIPIDFKTGPTWGDQKDLKV